MGDRNPFRISVDRGKDWLYWGEVGPDAAENADAPTTRGPKGYDEFNQAKAAGFFGWPYCIANNIPTSNTTSRRRRPVPLSTARRWSTTRPTTPA